MKIRNGFVSNSSSSSFICDQCGDDFSGYDLVPEDVDHYECPWGHVFCKPLEFDKKAEWQKRQKDHIETLHDQIDDKLWEKYPPSVYGDRFSEEYFHNKIREVQDEEYNEDWTPDDVWPEEACPICQMKVFRDVDLLEFLLLEYDYTREQVGEMLRDVFTDYGSFFEVINENKKRFCEQ